MAADATTAGISEPGSGICLFTRAFPRDERAHLVDAPGVQHVPRLDPAAPRGADAEPHLARQPLRAMAIAVDGDCHSSRDRAARKAAIHVEMAWRAVDFHRRASRRRR